MKPKNKIALLSAMALMAMSIPLSAYAASAGTVEMKAQPMVKLTNVFKGKTHGDKPQEKVREQLLALLKLDEQTYQEKLAQGKTLAQMAEEQGVSRDELKQALTADYTARLEQQKQAYVQNLDKWIDSKGDDFAKLKKDREFFKLDLSQITTALGITEADLKAALKEGKTLADVAKEKGVDVQKLIDIQSDSLLKKADELLKAGKLTQEQYDQMKTRFLELATNTVNGKLGDKERFGMKMKHKNVEIKTDSEASASK